MNGNHEYKERLLQLYQIKLRNSEITKSQYFSLKNFIDKNTPEIIRENIYAFEAYLYFFPDNILPAVPGNLHRAFFEKLLNELGLKIPSKIPTVFKTLYFTKLVKYVMKNQSDFLVKSIMKKFFSNALKRDFKTISLSEFKKTNKKDIKKLKKKGFPFGKWANRDFIKTYRIPVQREIEILIQETNVIIKKALGSRKKPGIIKNNEKLYSRLIPFLDENKIRNEKSLPLALETIFNSSFNCKDEEEEFYRNTIQIILKRYEDLKETENEVTFSFWKRQPAEELFLPALIDTCLSVSRGSFFCYLDFFTDYYMNVIKIETNKEITGLSYVFLFSGIKENLILLFDNIETEDNRKHRAVITDEILKYFSYVTRELGLSCFYLGKNYNDIVLPPLESESVYLRKFGLENNKKYYVDAFNGFCVPEGEIEVYKIPVV